MAFDPITVLNLVLALAVLAGGILGYRKIGSRISLYIAMAFGLFSITHILSLVDLTEQLEVLVIVLRAAGYLLVLYALLVLSGSGTTKKKSK